MTTVTTNLYPSFTYRDAPAAIEWLCRAFGFTRRLVVPGPEGSVIHSELSLGEGVVMVSSPKPGAGRVPRAGPESSTALAVYVEDPDAHFEVAKAADATIVQPLEDTDHGARGYMAADPEGHLWYFGDYRPGAYWDEPDAS